MVEKKQDDMEMAEGVPPPRAAGGKAKAVSWSETEAVSASRRKRGVARHKESVEDDDSASSDGEGEDSFDPSLPPARKPAGGVLPAVVRGGRRPSRPSIMRQSSRMVDRLKGEDEAAQAGFERHVARRAETRRLAEILGEKQDGAEEDKPSAEEAFDFFAKDWDEGGARREEDSKEETDEDEEGEGGEEGGTSDRKKLLAKDLLDGYGGYEWTVTEPAESWSVPHARRMRQERDAYFVPSSDRVDIERKLNADERPRFVEEEGVFIGERPDVPRRAKNRLENRILHEHERGARVGERKAWFGRDGRLVALPDPIQRKSTRPLASSAFYSAEGGGGEEYFDEGDSPAVQTAFCPPNLPGSDGSPAGVDHPGLIRLFGASGANGSSAAGQQLVAGGLTHCQLEVDVSSVVFDHHHLFSLEHHLSVRLTESFDGYQRALSKRQDLGLERRLKLLYEAVDDLKEKLEICVQKAERDFQVRRLESYRQEIRLVRQQRDEESAKERRSTKDILALWRSVKEVRRKQGYANTGAKLVIHKEAVNQESDKAEWEEEIRRELDEAREEHEAGTEKRTQEYHEKLRKWKETHEMRKAARRRKKRREQDAATGVGSADMAAVARDDELLAQPEEHKPDSPGAFDEEAERAAVEANARACRRPPGETRLYLELQRGASAPAGEAAAAVDSAEKARRASAAKTKIFVKLFFNGREVCQSSPKSLSASSSQSSGDDFNVPFANIFPLQIVQWPETLKLQILEGGHLRPTLIAEVSLPLPDVNTTLESMAAAVRPTPPFVRFGSDQRVAHGSDNAGVGSGVDFSASADGSEVRSERTRGRVFARVGWGRTSDGVILSPPAGQWRPPGGSNVVDSSADDAAATSSGGDPLNDILDESGRLDPSKIEDWMRRNNIDPNDPANLDLMERVAEAANNRRRVSLDRSAQQQQQQDGGSAAASAGDLLVAPPGGHFRLDNHHDQLVFCSQAEIERNQRFRLLEMRRSRAAGGEFKNFKMVPANEKEIPKGIFEAITRKASEARRSLAGPSGDPVNRSRGRLYLEQLRQQVGHHFSVARRRKRHADVVSEDPPPTMGSMFDFLLGEMAPQQRPLKPVRTERKKVALQDGQEVKILLSVVRAYDVPVRSDQDPLQQHGGAGGGRRSSVFVADSNPRMGSSDALRDAGPREALVRSYVDARFQGNHARTTAAAGPNPAWNQQLTLNFRSDNNDLSAETLDAVRDVLHIHLFDEVSQDVPRDDGGAEDDDGDEDGGGGAHVIHRRIERKWLGSLSVPFASLYRNTRVEGTFRLHSPAVLLGYERTGHLRAAAASEDGGAPSGSEGGHARDATYLNIYLTVEPPLAAPETPQERLDCEEEGEAVARLCERWRRDLEGRFPDRRVNAMVAGVGGRSVLVTRYFRAVVPPEAVTRGGRAGDEGEASSSSHSGSSTAARVAWFVSLVPYMSKAAMFPGLQEIWPSSADFVTLLCGSESEHAVLLANFLSGIGRKSYLVLGQGVPEGDTAYVLTMEESGEQLLWNAVTGESFSAAATFCPLTAVYALVDETNVWGNVQPSSCPSRMRWDLSSSSDWFPLFGRGQGSANPNLPSVQPEQISLSPPDRRAANALRERLERSLRDALMHLRKKSRTTINFQGTAVLRKLLPGLEASRGGLASGSSLATDHLSELNRLNTSHKICGFPLHFAYSDADQLSEALRATGVHLNQDPKVEFALAVHVEPYPATVMSVWVYVASMVRRR